MFQIQIKIFHLDKKSSLLIFLSYVCPSRVMVLFWILPIGNILSSLESLGNGSEKLRIPIIRFMDLFCELSVRNFFWDQGIETVFKTNRYSLFGWDVARFRCDVLLRSRFVSEIYGMVQNGIRSRSQFNFPYRLSIHFTEVWIIFLMLRSRDSQMSFGMTPYRL